MKPIVLMAVLAMAAYIPTDQDRARWTMSDMISWRIAIQAYATDHGVYPDVKSLAELRDAVQPLYIIDAPMTDAWGNAYRYERVAPNKFLLVSAGADGKFDETTWMTAAAKLPLDADAVVTNEGRWMFRSWDHAAMSDADRAQKTAYEIRVIKTAVEAYAGQHNQWPQVNTMEDLRSLVEPTYIKKLPMLDEWGSPFIYQLDANGGYSVRSVNLDRTGQK